MQPCKVLIVDDEPFVVQALKRALHKLSYEVVGAGCAAEALEILSAQGFDVVVSDEIMPGMPGSDFLGIVYEHYPETIRIMLTGHPNLDTALRAINNGHIYRFLIKPCSGTELSATIKQALQQRDLSKESHSLLAIVRRQSSMLEKLEKQNPGITWVDRDIRGAVRIPDVEYDLDTLILEINKEVKRSESFFARDHSSDST
ncbi:MAG TPA: response regulator [Syntrophobacteraceae bacterium]|nr:response regulator [Syntrophobacteraceae bacterium]